MKLSKCQILLLALCVLGAFGFFAPEPAEAGVEGIIETFTVDSGSSNTTLEVTMNASNIKEVYCYVPALDAGDTATLTLTSTPFASIAASDATAGAATIVPTGWTNKVVGATDDAAIVKCNTSTTNIYVDGTITFGVTCTTAQASDRVFWVVFLREY